MQLEEDILDGTQDELDLLRVGCACVMCVDLLRRRVLVERNESVEKVLARCVVVISARVVREVVA